MNENERTWMKMNGKVNKIECKWMKMNEPLIKSYPLFLFYLFLIFCTHIQYIIQLQLLTSRPGRGRVCNLLGWQRRRSTCRRSYWSCSVGRSRFLTDRTRFRGRRFGWSWVWSQSRGWDLIRVKVRGRSRVRWPWKSTLTMKRCKTDITNKRLYSTILCNQGVMYTGTHWTTCIASYRVMRINVCITSYRVLGRVRSRKRNHTPCHSIRRVVPTHFTRQSATLKWEKSKICLKITPSPPIQYCFLKKNKEKNTVTKLPKRSNVVLL